MTNTRATLTDADLYAVLARLNLRPRRAGKGWQARCPAHDDSTPSLSASIGDNGRLLLYCHAGCPFDAVRAALGVEARAASAGHGPPPPRVPSEYIAPNWRALVKSDRPHEVEAREHALGLPAGSLRRIGVVWAIGISALAAPMYGSSPEPIGVRLRADDGRKWAMSGSRNGLFGLNGPVEVRDALYLPEGMTDTAALVGLGLWAVGRPSCTGGRDLVRAFVRCVPRSTSIVVVSDADLPGRRGAAVLCDELTTDGRRVRMIAPPPGFKDVREWIASGATRDAVEFVARSRAIWTGGRA
jgi:hypothetical protein